ncbi:MAG: YitT family protein [Desulfobacteraceae bacterium]|nr:MAG: YitT family protein [Desulfobacteraceae bacterium]
MSSLAIAVSKRADFNRFFLSLKAPVINFFLIAAGSVIFSAGMNGILVPQQFISGGVTGLAMLIHYMLPSAGVGIAYFLLNLPLAALGWRHISRRFMVYTLFGIVVFSLCADAIHFEMPDIQDPILAALFAGVVCGIGGGLILRSMGSAGGFDILAIYVNKQFGFRVGMVGFLANAAVLGIGAMVYDIQLTLYSVIFFFTCSKVVDQILTGFNTRKSLIVISDCSEGIAAAIMQRHNRGVTYLKGMGAYGKKEKNVIFTITGLVELPKLKETIFALDPDAFVVVNDTLEVFGKRHGKCKVY